MTKVHLLLVAATTVLAGCSASGLPELVESPEGELTFLGQYGGRLSDNGKCITLITGKAAMDETATKGSSEMLLAVGPGFAIQAEDGSWVLKAPDGSRHRRGDLIVGSGGPFPEKAANPGAPLAEKPVRDGCPADVIQANSMEPLTAK